MIDLSRKYSLNFRAFYLLTTSFLAIFSLCLVSLFYTYTWIGKKLVTSKKISETILTFRSNIFDRNGLALAASRISADLYVHPNRVNDKERIAELFHRYLKLDYETTLNILKTNKNYHVLARHIDQDLAQSITRLIGRPDLVGYHKTFSRDYMFSDSLLPLLGKVSAAGAGSFGLELMLDKSLIKKASSSLSFQNGVVTTIDSEIQKSLDEAVEWSINEFKAKRVLGVVLDAHQGDILAYSQIDSQKTPVPKFLLTELVFEPGSTFKPFSLAIVLDLNLTRPDEILNCENGKFRLGRHIIRDVHPYSFLTVEETLMKSSNICTGKLALRVEKDKFLDYLLEFGFGKKVWMTQGESKGILFDKSNFKDIDAFVTSFGQGVAVTPIQLLQAFTVFLNGGKIIKPRILLSEPIKHQQVINQNTAQKIKEMLIKSVESGTGRNAKIPGFHVGGKTGTAQKIDPGKRGYIAGKYFSSFIGFVDFGNHEILAMFLIDEPSGDKYLGGQTAAPTFLRFFEKFIAKRLHEKLQIFSNSHAHANTISKTS